MDNFEARYLAIVDKDQKLDHPSICQGVGNAWFMWTDATWEPFSESIARAAVCWRLLEKLSAHHSQESRQVIDATDMQDAILTAWEIVLGIKEKP